MPFEETYEEDLVPRIRDLIDGYSKDSILKEYLQNADDSKATELIVTYDNRTHGNLNGTIFCEAKNPALLLYNNSKFEQSDFKSIVKISDQGKAEDAKSTGRFGQGFSSSFSVSDHPSFISNGKALWFDVLKKAVSKEKNKRSIQGWKEEEFSQIQPWLDTFSPACNDFNGTIFRLPLRTEETAKESKISHEIFLFDDFIKWCDEWKNNTSGLLFLRHIQRLVLQEIDDNGKLITHVEINTKNSAEIKKINDEIQKEFSNSLLDICSLWKAQDKTLPFFKYKHHFIVKHLNRENNEYEEYKESWAVVNGLFRGTDNGLINQAVQVLSISPNLRKVLPWTGVAILLDHKERPQKPKNSNYYTFLPLPIKSKHPVQIHGWFDLNPKRTEITHDGAGDDKEILIEWNKQLFKEGVGVAWAYLIDYIKKTCPNNSYYTLWPKNNDDHFDEYLLTGFYNKISELECLKTSHKNNTQWNTPKDDNIFYLQSGLDKNLFNAFREHFYLITYKPSQNVIKGLAGVDVDLQEIKPKFIREFLLEEAAEVDFPVSLNDVPIKMLSQRKWLLAILIFCAEAEDDADYGYLDELPLQITSDNKLYQLGDHCLVDEEPKFSIFHGNKTLFLDDEIVKIVKDAEVLPSSWYQPTLKNYLTVLHEYVDKYDLQNKAWLESLVTLIIGSNEAQTGEAVDELHQLQVVYQHDGSFGFLESKVDSPVLVPNEESSNLPLLAKTGMTLVHPDYIDIYRPLVKLKDVDLITKLTPFSLIKYLVHIPEEEYSFFKKPELREYLVNFIAQDISWFDELNENELEWLNDMPFIATGSDNLFSKTDDKKLFLPANFKPPENIQSLQGEYELIKVVDKKQQALFKKMGFKEQNPVNYLEEIVIPFIGSSPSVDDVKKILEWLANEWEQLTSDITEEEKDKLTKRLSESKIILDSGNNLNTASNYYHPKFLSTLPTFLQDEIYSPLSFEPEKTQKNWQNLLSILGSANNIIPQHIVDNVRSISEEQDHERSIKLLNYISNHFEWFDDMQYQEKPIFEYLSYLAWVPAEKPKNILRPRDEYEVLRKPSEIILAKDYMIAGGCHYSLSSEVKLGKKDDKGEFAKREMAQKIKLLVSLPTSSVFCSFLLLREIAINGQEKKISDYAKEFYKYIGRLTFDEIPDDIKEKSIFIMGRWLPSNKVFQSPPAHLSGIFSWDVLVTNDGTESTLAKGLIKLGVLARPDNNYLVDYLHNIPQNQKLNGQQLKESKAILKHFQDNLEDLEVNDIPFISRSDKLINCSDIYIKDLPAYNKSEKKNDQLEFCQQQFEKLGKFCAVVSLFDSVSPQLDVEHSQESEVVNKSWNDYIRSEPFKFAVLRLIYHEGERKISDDQIEQESIDKVLPSEVLLMDSLVVKYYINGTWIYDDVETSTYQDTENSILYLLNQDDEEDMCDSIAKFIQRSSNLSSDSLLLIARILRNKLNTLIEIKNLLDKQKIKSLPENIEIDDGISLYGDNTESSNNDFDDSTSHDEEIEQDDSPSDDFNQENEQSLSGDHHNGDTSPSKKIETKESEDEILPPTKPKHSGSNGATDTSSGGQNSNTGNNDHNWHNHNANRGGQCGAGGSRGRDTSRQGNNGSKTSSNPNPVSPNNRMPVYVGKEKELDKERTDEEREFAKNIGNKGENYVLEHSKDYLFSTSNRFVKAATDNNKGYDITEVDSSGEIIRYIEVKTLTGKWGEGGIGITESQLEFAQVYDNWWLFVVENINTKHTHIHVLENPVLQANRFMFDHSWKQLAVKAEGAKDINPQAGEKYLLSNGVHEILSVVPMGVLFKVKLKHIQSNKIVTKKFDPSWEKC